MIKGYSDLTKLPENVRIELIACAVVDQKNTVAVAIEDNAKKIARYEAKLHAARPGLMEIERAAGLIRGTVTLRIKPKTQNVAGN